MLLDRWAFNRAVRAKHAAIPLLGFEQGSAGFAFIEKQAGIGWHGFRFSMTAVRAGYRRVQNHAIHFPSPLTVDGYPAALVASVNLTAVAAVSSNCTVAVLFA
jgi:hypothetical protein